MLERAMMIGYRANFRHDEELALAFDMVTAAAARVLGIADYGIAAGGPADFVVVEAASVPEAVAPRPALITSLRRGRAAAASGGRKNPRLNSHHQIISYAAFFLQKKKKKDSPLTS